MRSRRSEARAQLRDAIQLLPRHTRIAMLAGIDSAPIIAGAYSDADGICPMLAAHRSGGRTSAIAFAKAWDRFALGDLGPIGRRRVRARLATRRELILLKVYLQASLLSTAAPERAVEPAAAPRPAPPRDFDRRPEPDQHDGWSWPRPVRSYDAYELVLATVTGEQPVASAIG